MHCVRAEFDLQAYVLLQINLDGSVLPLQELRGIYNVEALDLSAERVGAASTALICKLIKLNPYLSTVCQYRQHCRIQLRHTESFRVSVLADEP